MEFKGKLVRWNDDRGFGFIRVLSSDEDIFIHITALKDMPRRPVVGDIIYFQVEHREDGKPRAKYARIEGLTQISRKSGTNRNVNRIFLNFISMTIILFLIIGALYLFNVMNQEDFSGYKCEGKQYCSEMTCEEARFYVKNCPNVEIDGDSDGKPCEQKCGH